MNRDEQGLIQNLFGKLSQAETSAPPRDPEAERFIAESVGRQPGAPYYMAQTIIVQEQALEAAQARIQALEAQTSKQPSGGAGGFFGSLFGGGASASRQPARPGSVPQGGYGHAASRAPSGAAGPWGGGAAAGTGAGRLGGGGGGGFLAGAAQTAMGVAGGVVLGSMLSNAFLGEDPAAAAEGAAADAGDAAETELAGAEDTGGDFGGFDEV